jgi:dTDP-4-amino-4,6-dideoxygalactose transaminase
MTITETTLIPFNRPTLLGSELANIADAIRRGHAAGDGHYTRQCHELLEDQLGVSKALLTTSCTHALELSALLLELGPGDEVIIPSFTFVSTANAFVLRGVKPVFVDVRPDTLNLDERLLESAITPRTRAIVVVHYAGVACAMDEILETAQRHRIDVVEDNAHGLFGKYKGQWLGTFGSMAAQSFHETKNVSCGEGGALLINDPAYVEAAEIIREKGTDRSKFFRGEVDKYTWVGLGSSYLPSDLLAAFLYAQLGSWSQIQEARRKLWVRYFDGLEGWARENDVRLPIVPQECEQSYHMFYLLLPSLEQRQAFIAHLRDRGIMSVFHYSALHLAAMGRGFGGQPGDCPVTEEVADRLVRLPFFNDLSADDQGRVIEAVREFSLR